VGQYFTIYGNLQTRPLVGEGATKLQTRKCLKENSRRKQNWSQVPDGRLTPGQTGRLTVGRKLTNYSRDHSGNVPYAHLKAEVQSQRQARRDFYT
jgi:hypothetical protein